LLDPFIGLLFYSDSFYAPPINQSIRANQVMSTASRTHKAFSRGKKRQ
jgi:hypothetical protein